MCRTREERRRRREMLESIVAGIVIFVVILLAISAEAVADVFVPPVKPSETLREQYEAMSIEDRLAVLEACQRAHVGLSLAMALHDTESEINMPTVVPAGQTEVERFREELGTLGVYLVEYDNLEAALTAYRYGEDNGSCWFALEVIQRADGWQ